MMELCRDIDLASIAAFATLYPSPSLTYIDALAGTGVRGVRIANEVGLRVTINDRSTPACELIKRNEDNEKRTGDDTKEVTGKIWVQGQSDRCGIRRGHFP